MLGILQEADVITVKQSYSKSELSSLIGRIQPVDTKDAVIVRFWVLDPERK